MSAFTDSSTPTDFSSFCDNNHKMNTSELYQLDVYLYNNV